MAKSSAHLRRLYLLSHLPHMLIGILVVLYFSRLLVPAEFGKFARSYAYINVSGALMYGWLQMSLVRLASGYGDMVGPRITTVIRAMFWPVLPCFSLAYILSYVGAIFYPFATGMASVFLACSVCLAQMARGKNNPYLYATIGAVRLLGVLVGAWIVGSVSPRADSLLYALGGGALLSCLLPVLSECCRARTARLLSKTPSSEVSAKELFRYGYVASISIGAVMLMIHGDRFVVGMMLGNEAAASYTAQSELARQLIYPVVSALSVSIVPTALMIDRQSGSRVAKLFIARSAANTLLCVAPILLNLVFFPTSILSALLPEQYAYSNAWVSPLAATGAYLLGCRLARCDPVLHLDLRASHIGYSALLGLVAWAVFVYPLTFVLGVEGCALAGMLGSAISLSYSALISRSNGPGSINIVGCGTFCLMFLIALCARYIASLRPQLALVIAMVSAIVMYLALSFYLWATRNGDHS